MFGFHFMIQSQQVAEISAEEVADGRYVLFGRGGNVLLQLTDAEQRAKRVLFCC